MSFRFSKDQWLVLAAIICGISMVFLDSSILPVALPTIQRELGIADVNLQWIVNVYFLANASFVILGGKLADIYGSRNVYMWGLVLFAAASLLGGVAQNTSWLITSRGLQGFGAAILAPPIVAVLVAKFPPNQRGKAIGISVAASSIFLSIGPFIGGFLTEFISWRWVFFINIFICILGLFLTFRYVDKCVVVKTKIDSLGLVLFVGALGLATIGVMEVQRYGFLSIQVIGFLIAGICLATLFYIHYKISKIKEKFIDFSLFKKANFLVSIVQFFIMGFILMITVFLAIFFQDGMRFSPAVAGGWTVLSGLPILVMAPFAGYLCDKYGVKVPTFLGFTTLCATFLLIFLFCVTNKFYLMVLALLLLGCSGPLIITSVKTVLVGSVPPAKRGLTSGIMNTMRFTGSTLGMAVLGTVYTGVQEGQMERYITRNYAEITTEQKKELKLIYSGVKRTSNKGVKVASVRKDASAAAYLGLKAISSICLAMSIAGFGLIFLERPKKTNHKELL